MQVGLLGVLEVRRGGEVVPVTGARVRTLLARLALDAGREVSTAALIEAVWDEAPPGDAGHALQALVSRLRRALAPGDAIASGPIGYALGIAPEAVDALLFEALAHRGGTALRAGDATAALPLLREALGLWRGPALGELVGTLRFARDAAARLDDLRIAATADRIEAELALGSAAAGLVAELDALCLAHPLNERIAAQRLRALAAAGRSADALAAYEALRHRLDEELGAVPSPELVAAQLAVVNGSASSPGGTTASLSSPAARGGDAANDPVVVAAASPTPRPEPQRTNLRFGVTSFVGRSEELDRLDALLAEQRLVTLIGPGGAGKTRMAGEVAARQVDWATGGVWIAELASISNPADLGAGVLGALGMREARLVPGPSPVTGAPAETAGDPVDHLIDVLSDRDAVLVLDNCEHLIAAAAVLADELLARCAGLRIVATSREPLGIAGEHLVLVPPLGMPAPGAAAQEALACSAIRLFADRAAAASPGFVVDAATVGAVVEICRRLDGQPLAIELAAARLRSMPVTQIAERLDDRFRLLTGGSRAALPRQRTLRAVVDWSWELLTEAERILARRIAIFPAGVTLESAVAVCSGGGVDRADVADLLAALTDKSLLVLVGGGRADEREGPPRYRMLETIREYGAERLADAGELAELRTSHARYFAELVETADPHLRRAEQLPWFRLLRAERENVLAALRWLAETADARRAVQLAVSLGWFWLLSGSRNDAAAVLRQAIMVEGPADEVDRLIATTIVTLTDDKQAQAAFRDTAGTLVGEIRSMDHRHRPIVSIALPMLSWLGGDLEIAEELFAEALEHPDPWVRAVVPLARAQWAENLGDVAGMRVHFDAALAAFREVGDRWGTTAALTGIGGLAMLDADLDAAAAALEEASVLLDSFDAIGERSMLGLRLADVRHRQGDLESALHHARRAREGADLASTEWSIAGAGLARLLWLVGEQDDARETIAAALHTAKRVAVDGHPATGHLQALVNAAAALIALDDGRPADARDHLLVGYPGAVASEDQPIAALVGVATAAYACHSGNAADAAEILGAAAALRGSPDPTNVDIARLTQRLGTLLGAAAFERAFAAGLGLDRDAAIARIDPESIGR